jgi:DNA-binding GntR family transcriptional regulator
VASPPAKEPSAIARVTDILRQRLITGGLRPGEMTTLRTLAEELGVSAMPVREAAGRLASETALELVKNRGIRVPEMSRERLFDLTAVRVFLETELSKRAAFAITKQTLIKAESANQTVDGAIAADDAGAYMRANYEFHFTIYRAAASPTLLRLAEGLWTQTGPFMSVVYAGLSRLDYSDHHPRILDALSRRAPADAADAVRADIESGLDLIARSGFFTAPATAALIDSRAARA